MLWQSTVEGENEVWPDCRPSDEDLSLWTPDSTPATKTCRWGPRIPPQRRRPVAGDPGFSPQPEGTGLFFPISPSIVARIPRYAALRSPRTEKKWLPSLSCQYMSIRPCTGKNEPCYPAPSFSVVD